MTDDVHTLSQGRKRPILC